MTVELLKNTISFILSLIYSAGPPTQGIDISHRQGDITWRMVSKDRQNIEFVYIKATEGATYQDPKHVANIQGAHDAGLETGLYHFFRMTSTPEDQFDNFKACVDSCRNNMTLIPVIDVETYDGKTSMEVKNAVERFVRLFYQEYSVFPIVYGPDIAPQRMLSDYVNDNCLFFIGQPDALEPKQSHAIWQYSCRAVVDGIPTRVDIDRLHKDYKLKDIMWECKHSR